MVVEQDAAARRPEGPRARDVLAVLRGTGSARIGDLARRLGISEETVRRTVRRLEAQGLVTKVHGGVHLRQWNGEPSFEHRIVQNPEAKRRIAATLAAMIPDGASLFLDVGTTTAYVAEALRDHRSLLVVTNSLPVAQRLVGGGQNRVLMAGGELRAHDGGAFGAEALAFVRRFRVDLAVLTAVAVNARTGFMLHDLQEAEFSREIIRCAERSLLAADSTKFGLQAPIRITDPEQFDTFVTDIAPPADIAAMLAAAGVRTVVAAGDG